MTIKLRKRIFKLLFFLFLIGIGGEVKGQIFPGDANDDGIVNNIDVLYIGYAFGEVGPTRITLDASDTLASEVALFWEAAYPDGLNYIYADADGNGLVDWEDILVVLANYNLQKENINPTIFFSGIAGIDPVLSMEPAAISGQLTEGALVSIPVQLGSDAMPLQDFNGIAFSIEYDPKIIKNLKFELADSWMDPDESLFPFQFAPSEENGQLDLAFTRIGVKPVTGGGLIGRLNFVIEDDLIAFLQDNEETVETPVKFSRIKSIDSDFMEIPIVTDSLTLTIMNPKLIVSDNERLLEQVKLYPNPAGAHVWLSAPFEIESIDIYDFFGKRAVKSLQLNQQLIQLPIAQLAEGIYWMDIFTKYGKIRKKLIIGK